MINLRISSRFHSLIFTATLSHFQICTLKNLAKRGFFVDPEGLEPSTL